MKILKWCAIALLSFMLVVSWANLAAAQKAHLNPAKPLPTLTGLTTGIITDLTQIPNIPFKDYPSVEVTESVVDNLLAVSSEEYSTHALSLPIGQQVPVLELLEFGNFQQLGLTDLNLTQLGSLVQSPMADWSFLQLSPVYGGLTLREISEIGELLPGETLVGDVPALKALVEWAGGRTDSPLASTIELSTSVEEILGSSITNAISIAPELKDVPIAQVGETVLSTMTLAEGFPGLETLELNKIPNVTSVPMSVLNDTAFSNLSLADMPIPLSLAANIGFGEADFSLGDPSDDAHANEQERIRVVTGGITSSDFILQAGTCPQQSCPHFEVSSVTHPNVHGAAWMDSTGQTVPDGFGILCRPWACKGPPGSHPFGAPVRVILKNIDQATGTADLAITFPWCSKIPFLGLSCTPWILPSPDGIPLGKIQEKTLLAYSIPGEKVQGEVLNNPFPNPHVAEVPTIDGGTAPSGPVPPPVPCEPGEQCDLHHPLPQNSGVPLNGVGHCRGGCSRRHAGVDTQSVKGYQARRSHGRCVPSNRLPCGENVVAAADGTVGSVTSVGGTCGGIVHVNHPQLGLQTRYLHMAQVNVSNNQAVLRGQVLGIEGDEISDRCSFGTHLHYEIHTGGRAVNPMNYRHTPRMVAN
ncbi:M23 family metallopeptidase [Leptolyngbya sp. AN02str]|uniref:M23 family metallopeptidase n=1 Tax=Leptolyngbya sp. AN02str TaxID=3423363 RepID=UPI003D316F68